MGILYILNPLQSHKKSYDVTVSTISKEIPDTEKKYQKGEKQPVWKCRYVVVLIGFFLYFYLNAYRINTSVNIVAMVNSSALTTVNKTESDSCPHLKRNTSEFQNETDTEEDGDFNWSYKIQGYIVSSYFIGYSIAPLPVGSLIERYGCKWFIFAGSFISGVGTLLVPFFSWLDVYALIVLQTCRGLSQGVVPPSLTLLTANWFPKLERGFFFTIMQSGAALGSCLGGLFAGYLCDSSGRWPSSFYVFGSCLGGFYAGYLCDSSGRWPSSFYVFGSCLGGLYAGYLCDSSGRWPSSFYVFGSCLGGFYAGYLCDSSGRWPSSFYVFGSCLGGFYAGYLCDSSGRWPSSFYVFGSCLGGFYAGYLCDSSGRWPSSFYVFGSCLGGFYAGYLCDSSGRWPSSFYVFGSCLGGFYAGYLCDSSGRWPSSFYVFGSCLGGFYAGYLCDSSGRWPSSFYVFGSCLGGLYAGYLCDSSGRWPSSFYVFGVGGLLLSAVILFFAVESPNEHRKISKAELNFILSNQETTLNRRRPRPPWSKIIRSVPVYAAAFGCFGQMWAISQFMLVHSTFLGTILHYPIAQNGLLSAAPFILQFFCSQVGGWFSSFMLKKKFAGVDFLRKFFNLISCLGYSGCLVGICFAGCDRELSSLFSVLSTGFTGFGFAGAFIISADMSPKFAGTMMAICCTSACLSGVILPVIVGHLTEKTQTIEQWNKVFFITIAVVLSSGIVFAVFGSAEVQPWNYDEDDASDKSENAKYINSDKKSETNMTEEIHPDRKKSVNIEIKLTKF